MNIFRYISLFITKLVRKPEIDFDFTESGYMFAKASNAEANFIEYCQDRDLNKDSIFKRKITISDADGNKISGVARIVKSQFGDKIWVSRKNEIYECLEPINNGEYQKYELEDIVDTTQYKGGMITKYLGNGAYELTFADNRKVPVQINTIIGISKTILNLKTYSIDATEREVLRFLFDVQLLPDDYKTEFADHTEIRFSYSDILDGVVSIFNEIIVTRYKLSRSRLPVQFSCKTVEEFAEQMEERLGLYMV